MDVLQYADVDKHWRRTQKSLGSGFFSGEGFILQAAKGESLLVDTGCLAAMTDSCTMTVETVKGASNLLFGGEGIFHTKITGPGTVYLQSMPVSNTAAAIRPYLNIPSNNNSSN